MVRLKEQYLYDYLSKLENGLIGEYIVNIVEARENHILLVAL
jgi:hypothetical protein